MRILCGSSYLRLREFPTSRVSRHNRGSYWTGNGGHARPITAPVQSSGQTGVKTGGFPAAHKALTSSALYSRFSPQKRRLSLELARRTSGSSGACHCASRYLPDSTNAGFIDEELMQCSRKEKEILRDREKRSSPDQKEIGTQWKRFICNVSFFYLNFTFG